MAREFSSAMEDAARDTGLSDAANSLNDLRDVTSKRSMGVEALDRAADRFEKWDPKIPSARAPAKPDPAANAPVAQDGATPASAPAAAAPAAPVEAEPAAGQRRLHAVRRGESKDA